jgi:hypothetical protein
LAAPRARLVRGQPGDPVPLKGIPERSSQVHLRRPGESQARVRRAGGSGTAQRVEPDLLDEVAWWQLDDFWPYPLFAAIAYIRVAANRAGVPQAPTGTDPIAICLTQARENRLALNPDELATWSPSVRSGRAIRGISNCRSIAADYAPFGGVPGAQGAVCRLPCSAYPAGGLLRNAADCLAVTRLAAISREGCRRRW